MKEGHFNKGQAVSVRNGIVMFRGRLSRNLLIDPMVSNAFFLEDEEEAILYDPSCGKEMAAGIEVYIRRRQEEGARWKRAFVVAGHSHLDHASNFFLGDALKAREVHVYVHEAGFRNGRVANEPAAMFEALIEDSEKYFNRYRSFSFPYNLLMGPFARMHRFFPVFTRRLWSRSAALCWPSPVNGSARPEPLREADKERIQLGDTVLMGWKVGNKVLLPSPGHSPCSISLLWKERKALFVSDADWIGNPVFLFSSLSDCITSLETFKMLTETGWVDLFLPAHGQVKEGPEKILNHLNLRIGRLKNMRDEVLSAYHTYGERDVPKLAEILVKESPFFRSLKLTGMPRMVLNVHDIVALCLKENGILE